MVGVTCVSKLLLYLCIVCQIFTNLNFCLKYGIKKFKIEELTHLSCTHQKYAYMFTKYILSAPNRNMI